MSLLAFVAVQALQKNPKNASLVAGKVPLGELPGGVNAIAAYASKSDFPATGETATLYIANNEKTQWMWAVATSTYYCVGAVGYESVILSPSTIHTISSLKTLVDQINAEGRHVLFDFTGYSQSFSALSKAYICAVDFYDNGSKLCIVDLIGGIVYDSGVNYSGNQYIENYCRNNMDRYAYGSEITGMLKYTVMQLTDAEKAQAVHNIGLSTEDTVTSAQWATYTGNAETVDVLD